jgi:protein-S-isoprenylcysteine O-methyltransferase Ste14
MATTIGLVVAVAVVAWSYHGVWTISRAAGSAVGGAGLVLLLVARWQLGAAFSVQAKARHLVTTGVYARIRNPIYVAGEILLLGAAIVLRSWMPLLIAAVTVPIQIMRARREADVLREAFGQEYEAYRARTWF